MGYMGCQSRLLNSLEIVCSILDVFPDRSPPRSGRVIRVTFLVGPRDWESNDTAKGAEPMAKPTTALVVVTLMAMVAAGCTTTGTSNDVTGQTDAPTQDGSSTTRDPGSGSIGDNGEGGEDVPDESPIGAAVTEVAGYTEADVGTAVNNARFDSIIGCMTEQGWDYGYDDLPEAGPTTGEISYFGTQIQYYLDELDRSQRDRSSSSR